MFIGFYPRLMPWTKRWVMMTLIPNRIIYPDVTKHEDWDEEEYGEWIAPTIPNVDYKGPWTQKKIKNPKYKCKWKTPLIDNPVEKGSRSTVEYRRADSSEQSESGIGSLPHDAVANSPIVLPSDSIPSLTTTDLQSLGQSNEDLTPKVHPGRGRASPTSVSKAADGKQMAQDKAAKTCACGSTSPAANEKVTDPSIDPETLDVDGATSLSGADVEEKGGEPSAKKGLSSRAAGAE